MQEPVIRPGGGKLERRANLTTMAMRMTRDCPRAARESAATLLLFVLPIELTAHLLSFLEPCALAAANGAEY